MIFLNDIGHVIPVRLFPLPFGMAHAIYFRFLEIMTVAKLLKLQNQFEIFESMLHLDLISNKANLVRVGLDIFRQEKHVKVNSNQLF
jgi:predicted tellurium resistance membrane protein TerC